MYPFKTRSMKVKIHKSTFLLASFIFSCNERSAVMFSESQPKGAKELSVIPQELQGYYLNISDSSNLFISSNLIYRTSYFPTSTHKNDLDSGFILKGGTIYNETTKELIKVKLIGDTIRYTPSFTDTMYRTSSDFVLKKFKGRYFLNEKVDTKSWETKQIVYDNGKLSISYISSDSVNFQKLTILKENIIDSIYPIKIKPTKKEFKKLVKQEFFDDEDMYIKIKKNDL